MNVLKSIAAAFGMYSVLPAPYVDWNPSSLRYVLWAFPLIGLVCAGSWWLIALIPLNDLLRGAALFLAPLLITGGIHLDGYLDVYDALASHGSVADRVRILHDPAVGAFAVIHLAIYAVASVALCATLVPTVPALGCLGAVFVLSRALVACSLATRPVIEGSSLARRFAEEADRRGLRWFSAILVILCGGVQVMSATWLGGICFAAALLACAWCLSVAQRRFGGLSGDLCGWMLVKVEFWSLAAFVLLQWWFL